MLDKIEPRAGRIRLESIFLRFHSLSLSKGELMDDSIAASGSNL